MPPSDHPDLRALDAISDGDVDAVVLDLPRAALSLGASRWAVLREWGFRGLGSLPPALLRRACVDPATRIARRAGGEDVEAVLAAFGARQTG